jgi:anti-sigma B factor antagonist
MDIVEHQNEDVTIVEVRGRIDSTTAREFGDRLSEIFSSGRTRVVLELRDTPYMSSAGFRVLLIAAKRLEAMQGRLVLCGLSPELRRLFDLGAFTDLFQISTSREDALAASRSRAT